MATNDFDDEGRAVLSPKEFQERLYDGRRRSLINGLLIPATPKVFGSRHVFYRFTELVADLLLIHPRNLIIRGSTLLGYSFAPVAEKVWRRCKDTADLDLAIVDADYYHMIDRELRYLENRDDARSIRDDTRKKRERRSKQRQFYYYRYFDLPDTAAARSQADAFRRLGEKLREDKLLDHEHEIQAFVFRDWLSLYTRWEFELQTLENDLKNGLLVRGEVSPREPAAPQ